MKFVKWVREGQGQSVIYRYELPEVEDFLRENDMANYAETSCNIYGQYGVRFQRESDAVIFKLAFL